MDYPRYRTEQAAAAAGIPTETLSTWLKRPNLSMVAHDDPAPDVLAPGRGRGRLFTRRSVIRIAIMARLTRIGLSVDAAHSAAMRFSDVGTGSAAYEGEQLTVQRGPGDLFPSGGTVMRIDFPEDDALRVAITRLADALSAGPSFWRQVADVTKDMAEETQRQLGAPLEFSASLVINLDQLVRATDAALAET